MTDQEFSQWCADHKRLFDSLADPGVDDFLIRARERLNHFTFDELTAASLDIKADLRREARFVHDHLPLLILYAGLRRERNVQVSQLDEYKRLGAEHAKRRAARK